ncbi:MAG: peptidylprolyl isomerase [SAR324 cluster bacterium]|nr:peptidylprolyl isomerase [SAR324 cluster bacterium]
MNNANTGDTVKVHYKVSDEDGVVFDSSFGSEPLEFTIGNGGLIPGFEYGVVGMVVGEKKEVTVSPAEGYGERREELSLEVEKDHLPQDLEPEIGMELQSQQNYGNLASPRITDISEKSVTVDANPPLAGKTLQFEIQLIEIE